MNIQVLAGLGNPGPHYASTRHNIGFAVIDALAAQANASWKLEKCLKGEISTLTLKGKKCILVKPHTYMNDSGACLQAVLRYYRHAGSALVVIYDDIQLDVGRLKISVGGGDGGHNGVASVMAAVDNTFVRYRIGVGAKPFPEMDLKDYVLGAFTAAETAVFSEKLPHYTDGLNILVQKGSTVAMNQFNKKVKNTQIKQPRS